MGVLDSLLKKVASGDSKDKFEQDKREDIDTNTKKYSHYDKDGNLVYYHIETYDNRGRIIRKAAFNAAGGSMGEYPFTYTADGKDLDGAWCVYNEGYLMKIERQYDALGRLAVDHRHGNEVHKMCGNKTIYHYIGDTSEIEFIEYYSHWEENGTHNAPVFRYTVKSADCRSVRVNTYNESRVLTSITALEYDENHHKILEVTAGGDEIVNFYNTYKYDGAGKTIENNRFDVKGEHLTIADVVSKIIH